MPRGIREAALASLLAIALAGCGGGGGETYAISGEVKGFTAGEGARLLLAATPGSEPIVLVPPVAGFSLGGLMPGQPYRVTVVQHPYNQLCRVENGEGVADSAEIGGVRVVCHATLINDTGGREGADGQAGRDAVSWSGVSTLTKKGAGDKGFDFTRLCVGEAGDPSLVRACTAGETTVGIGAGQWACTRDNVTGLVWPMSGAAWGLGAPFLAAGTLPSSLAGLCGVAAGDWRLPTAAEFMSIVDIGRTGIAIDQAYFPVLGAIDGLDGRAAFLVRATELSVTVDPDAGPFYYLDLADGQVVKADVADPADRFAAYVVAGGTDPRPPAYRGDLLVDERAGLMWYLPPNAPKQTHGGAGQSVAALNAAAQSGFSDWRLPDYKELATLVAPLGACAASDTACQLLRTRLNGQVWWSSSIQSTAAGSRMPWVLDLAAHADPAAAPGGFALLYAVDAVLSMAAAIPVRNIVPGE